MSTLAEAWKALQSVATLTADLQRYHAEIKDLHQELRDLTLAVTKLESKIDRVEERTAAEIANLAQQIKHSEERVADERRIIRLELENRLLRVERGLPPAPKDE